MSLTKATVFRAKPGVTTFEQLIRSEDRQGRALPALKAIELPPALDFGPGTNVEIRAAFKSQPGKPKNENDIPWLAFLNSGMPTAEKFKFQSRNSHPSAVVAVKVERAGEIKCFALTFGLGGETFLHQEALLRDFGIRVAMNICDEEKLKRVRTSIHEAISTQAERQISAGSPFRVFGIDDEREFLRSVSGTASSTMPYVRSITGRDSINISFDPEDMVNWNNIVPRLEAPDEASKWDRYREIFHGYDRFAIENDRETVRRLDAALFERLRNGELQHIHLAPPEFVDFDSREFSYSSENDAPSSMILLLKT